MANSKPNYKSTSQKKKTTPPQKSANSKSDNAVKKIPTQEQKMATRQRTAIIFMAAALFLICVVLIEGQNVWTNIHNVILGLFGYCAYIWPFMLIYMAIVCAANKPLGNISVSFSGIAAFIILIGGAIHVYANTFDYLHNESIGLQISAAWGERINTPNGGALGALTGGIIVKLFGKTGAIITIILLSAVMLMLLTRTTLLSVVKTVSKPVKKVNENNVAKKETKCREPKDISKSKPFNPPKVISEEDSLSKNSGTWLNSEFVPIVPAEQQAEQLITSKNDIQVEISIPNFKKNNTKQKEEDIKKSTSADVETYNKNVDLNRSGIEKSIYGAAANFKKYKLPPIDCLSLLPQVNNTDSDDELRVNGQKLIDILKSFGIQAKILMISRGPSVTRFELQPEPGVRINRFTNLSDDIALGLASTSVRIEAPIPNKSAIGVEVPNKSRANVAFREIVDTKHFRNSKSKLNVALGKDIAGNIVCADLDKMPHLLIAGTTGSGKSVCINSMIVSLLFNASPEEVKLLLIDPKQGVELRRYNDIPHLQVPVVSDARKAAGALGWAVSEMTERYKTFSEKNVRDIESYNMLADKTKNMERMHRIVIFIDELNDLMMVAPHEVEDYICRLAQMARAAGMHLVVATQRPSADVITGLIKSNIPSRIALYVPSYIDSRIIIDMSGAEKLLGNGDMLFSPVGIAKPVRVQGCYISDSEIENTLNYIKSQSQASYDEHIIKEIDMHAVETKKKGVSIDDVIDGERKDEMLPQAIQIVAESQNASTTFLQRKLKIGYARAANIIDSLEEKQIVGPLEGSKPRKVLITKQQWMERNALSSDNTTVFNEAGSDE